MTEVPPVSNAPVLYDFEISFNDTERGLSETLRLRTARHPSETLERVWLRVIAYCWRYEERLAFGPGLADTEAPDLLATDLTGLVTQWIRVGKSEPAKIQRAVDQNPHAKVSVLFESQLRLTQFRAAAAEGNFSRLAKATIATVDSELLASLAREDRRRNAATITLVGDELYIDHDGETLQGKLG